MAQESIGKEGVLYLCATPIGNLGDISLRVLDTLREVDLIAAEDTRNSIKLLNHFKINKPLTSYHEYHKYDKARELADKLHKGENVALVTDAGTPAISDPGEVLVRLCREEGITVTSLPGPCAVITALSASGISARRFCFEGFLPSDKREAPHHLLKTLKELYESLGERELVLCRELTKKHEEYKRLLLSEAIGFYETEQARGEFVLVIEGRDPLELKKEREASFQDLSVKEHVKHYEAMGYDRKESMKLAAKDRGVSKRDIYNSLLD